MCNQHGSPLKVPIPDEMMLQVLQYLTTEALANVRAVNTQFRRVAQEIVQTLITDDECYLFSRLPNYRNLNDNQKLWAAASLRAKLDRTKRPSGISKMELFMKKLPLNRHPSNRVRFERADMAYSRVPETFCSRSRNMGCTSVGAYLCSG